MEKQKSLFSFFEVLDNIDGKIEENGVEKTVPLLFKGEIVMRVGSGLVAPDLPISTIYTIPYKPLFDKKLLKQIEDQEEKQQLEEVFKDIIEEVRLEVSTSVLNMLETHSEFISIPEHLHSYLKEILKLK